MANSYEINFSKRSWVQVPASSDFPIQNLPLGIFSTKERQPRVGMAIGDQIIDIQALQENGFLKDITEITAADVAAPSLNQLLRRGRKVLRALRTQVADLLDQENNTIQSQPAPTRSALSFSSSSTAAPTGVSAKLHRLLLQHRARHQRRQSLSRPKQPSTTELEAFTCGVSWAYFFYCSLWDTDTSPIRSAQAA